MNRLLTCTALLLFATISFVTDAQFNKIYDFLNTAKSGNNPLGNLYYSNNYLWGMTNQGGPANIGTLFTIKTDGTNYDTLMCFRGVSNGKIPHGSLISDGTYLYGVTQYGGDSNAGTVFKILPNGNGYFKMYDFDGTTNGKAPFGALCFTNGYLYGTPQIGGTNHVGTMFKILPSGLGYSKLYEFTGNSGTHPGGEPEGTVVSDGTYLYGTAYNGGTHFKGVIFRFNMNTLVYDTIFTFNGSNGSYPTNSLVTDSNYLYGMTESGGLNGLGTIFRIKTDGTMYQDMHDFITLDGTVPHGGFYREGNMLYGFAQGGGQFSGGTIFEIQTNGNGFTKLHDFDGGVNGKQPFGDPVSDGTNLYGFTALGGTGGFGTIFSYQYVPLKVNEVKANIKTTIYPNPNNGSFNLSIRNSQLGIGSVIEIYNMLGERVKNEELRNKNANIDMTDQPAGIYLYRVTDETGNVVGEGKFVIEK